MKKCEERKDEKKIRLSSVLAQCSPTRLPRRHFLTWAMPSYPLAYLLHVLWSSGATKSRLSRWLESSRLSRWLEDGFDTNIVSSNYSDRNAKRLWKESPTEIHLWPLCRFRHVARGDRDWDNLPFPLSLQSTAENRIKVISFSIFCDDIDAFAAFLLVINDLTFCPDV